MLELKEVLVRGLLVLDRQSRRRETSLDVRQ